MGGPTPPSGGGVTGSPRSGKPARKPSPLPPSREPWTWNRCILKTRLAMRASPVISDQATRPLRPS